MSTVELGALVGEPQAIDLREGYFVPNHDVFDSEIGTVRVDGMRLVSGIMMRYSGGEAIANEIRIEPEMENAENLRRLTALSEIIGGRFKGADRFKEAFHGILSAELYIDLKKLGEHDELVCATRAMRKALTRSRDLDFAGQADVFNENIAHTTQELWVGMSSVDQRGRNRFFARLHGLYVDTVSSRLQEDAVPGILLRGKNGVVAKMPQWYELPSLYIQTKGNR